jgi:hypothetical protein
MGWQDDDVVGSHPSVKTQPTDLGHTARMIPSSFNKGVAGVLDAVLNTPTNLANIGVSGAGMAALALGSPETASKLAGYVTQQPNYARRAFEKIGAIENINPQSAGERIADIAAQGAGGSVAGPNASLISLLRNASVSAAGGAAGQGVTEATGSPLAGQLTSLVVPAVLPNAELAAALAKRKQANAARDAITTAGMEQGYVLPPSINNSTWFNRFVESLGGKAATRQAAEIANQPVTNKLVRQQLGLAENAPITESALSDLRSTLSEPYKKVASIAPYKEEVQSSQIDPITNQPVTKLQTVNPSQILDDLKIARANANQWWKAYSRDAHPETKDKAQAYTAEANALERRLEGVAEKTGNSQLINELRDARRQIAQTYDVEKALNIGTTNVSARDIGSALSKGAPFTGNLKTIGEFAEQNPLYTRETSDVSTPGVDALRTVGGTMTAASGHPGAALAAFLGAPARAVALSRPYQNMFAMPNYDPGMLAKMLKNYTPFERDLIMAQMAARQSQEQK